MADRLGTLRRALWTRREDVPHGGEPLPEPVQTTGPEYYGHTADEVLATLSRRCEALAARQQEQLERLADGLVGADEERAVRHLVYLARQVGRTGADLRVLAGRDAAQLGGRPRALLDVLDAAAAEVRAYRRVVVRRPPQLAIAPEVARDLVHLLADLLDTAASWCARDVTMVLTAARWEQDGAVVELDVPGTGLSRAQLHGVNAVLAGPGGSGTSTVQTGSVGLVVVGRLAARHGITVEAHQGDRGVVVILTIPSECRGEPAVAEVRRLDIRDVGVTREAGFTDDRLEPSVEEQWTRLFGRRGAPDPPGRHAAAGGHPHSRWFAPGDDAAAPAWASVGDAGWLAAGAVQGAATPDVTPAGLPQRRRGARLLPGSVVPEPQRPSTRNAASVRGRLDSYQRGLSRGRHALQEPGEQW